MSYHYGFGGTVSVSERLPNVHLGLAGTVTVEAGAQVLAKVGDWLATRRVFIKRGDALVDADA